MARHDLTGTVIDDEIVSGGPFVSVAALVAALRRGWRLCAAGAVLGMVVGLVLSAVFSPPSTATTAVLLRHPSFLDPAQAMATDAQLMSTRTVAERAIELLELEVDATAFAADYRATVLTNDLLRIAVDAPSAREAVRRADAVALAFLEFRAETFRRQTELALAGLRAREEELEADLAEVNDQVDESSRETEEEVRALGELLFLRSTLGGQLADVRRRIDSTTAETDAIVQQSIVVDPATAQRRSPLRAAVVNVVPAAILGLLAVSGWLLLRELVNRPVRRRVAVAAALGAPVEANMPAVRSGPRWPWRPSRPQMPEPRPETQAAITHLRAALHQSVRRTPAVLVVGLGDGGAAAEVVSGAAAAARTDGATVLVVDASAGRVLAHLKPKVAGNGGGPLLCATYDDIVERAISYQNAVRRATYVIGLATLDPALGADHLVAIADTAVAVVGAGRVSATALSSASTMLRAAGITLDSAILAGADRSDETVGLSDRRRDRSAVGSAVGAR